MSDRRHDDEQAGPTADETSLSGERDLAGFVTALRSLAKRLVGAADVLVYLAQDDGRLARADRDDEIASRAELGFDTLPAQGIAATAPGPWRDRHAWAALPLAVGSDALLGVLVVGFDGARPATRVDWDVPLRATMAVAAGWLERRRLRAAIASAQTEGFVRAGAGLAHVLGNVLQAVQSSIDTARLDPTGDARATMSEASSALRRAASVVRQLASLGGTRGDPQPTEMGTLVSGLVASIESSMPDGVALRLERTSRAEIWCQIDGLAVEAALAGLLHRARDGIAVAGEIVMALRMVPDGANWLAEIEVRRVQVRPSGERVASSIVDARRDVPENDGGDAQGAGELRLTMARAALTRYGGTVEDFPGEPSITRVRLPMSVHTRATITRTAMTPMTERSLRVLVADDEPAVLRGVQRLLVHAGHAVVVANDGVEALALARSHGPFDVALLDLTMPRLGGPPLVAALRKVAPAMAVVVMTGYASTAMTEALRNEGVTAVLTKPVAGASLLGALSQAVQG